MIGKIRGREAGMSFWPFAVSLVLLFVAVIFWYDGTKDTDSLRQQLAGATQRATDANAKYETVHNRMIDLATVTGFPDAASYPDKEQLSAALTAFLDKWREALTVEFDADRYQESGSGGKVEKLSGNRIRVVYLPTKAEMTAAGMTVDALLPLLTDASARMQADIKRAFEAAAASAAEVASLKTAHAASLTAKDTDRTNVQNQLNAVQQQAAERERELLEQIRAKDAAVAQAQAELETVRAKSAEDTAKLTRDVSQKAAEIQTLARRDAPVASEGPDGEVLAAGSGLAVLSRGKKDMLMPGTTFMVLGRRKGGDLVPKGIVHVTLVHDLTAEARVVEESPNDPINTGDLIQSGVYSPNRQLRFTLIGEFRRMGRSQAEGRLRSLGAAVDTQVTTLTNYLVMGGGENLEESDSYRRAKEYGITILTEDSLSSFTLY